MGARTATVITFGTLGSNVVVASNQSVTVSGIILSNTAAGNVEITFSNSAGTVLFSISVRGEDTVVVDLDFMVDNGLKADALTANQKVTFFHSQPGA